MNWGELFVPHILERGQRYYEDGRVEAIKKNKNGFVGWVSGSEDYQVQIRLSGSEITGMFCTCPYAEDGAYCKHMAAVLFALKTEGKKIVAGGGAADDECTAAIVMKADEEFVRTFLIEVLAKDALLLERFKNSCAL